MLGYCTNVHAGASLAQTRAQLAEHAVAVRRGLDDRAELGIGLWLSNRSAEELDDLAAAAEFAAWLAGEGLVPYTMNGFPYYDFHRPVVQHEVYLPAWDDPARREYTLRLARLLDRLLPPGRPATISTLPLAWGNPPLPPERRAAATANLLETARALAELEAAAGRHIRVCLEPEPGCELQRTSDMLAYFLDELYPADTDGHARRHLGVCHDICHAGVMFEPQRDVLRQYASAGIAVGKIQVSSAVRASFADPSPRARAEVRTALEAFEEPRYLHQTSIRRADGRLEFHENLPLALAAHPEPEAGSEWRVHFHVPIFLESFGPLFGLRDEIDACLAALPCLPEPPALEVETYAWGVLPVELRQETLAGGIVMELRHLEKVCKAAGMKG